MLLINFNHVWHCILCWCAVKKLHTHSLIIVLGCR